MKPRGRAAPAPAASPPSPLRLPAPIVFAVVAAGLAAAARQAKLDRFFLTLATCAANRSAACGDFSPLRALPPLWELTATALKAHLVHGVELAWLLAVFVGTGRAACAAFKIRCANRWESLAFWFALAGGLWGSLFLFLGLLGALYRPLLLGLLGAGSLWTAWDLWTTRPRLPGPGRHFLWSPAAAPWTVLLAVQLLILAPYAFVPETFFDALEYHLALPNLYLINHAIRPTIENSFSGVPSIPAMLYGWALAVDPLGIVAHLLNFGFLGWILIAIVGIALRLGAPEAGVLGAALFAAVPVVGTTAITTTVELAWAFYQLMCFPALLSALEFPRASPERRRWLIVAGLCLGFALSSKYIAWAAPFALLLPVLMARRDEERPTPREFGLILGVSVLVLLPWLLKNVAFYRNPIFPFFHEWWNPRSEVMPGWRYLGGGTTLSIGGSGLLGYAREYGATPWNMIFYKATLADSIGTVLLPLLSLLLLVRLTRPRDRRLAYFALGCWLPLSFAIGYPRYYIPALAPLALTVALIVARLEEPRLRKALAGTTFAGTLALVFASAYWNYPVTRTAVITGEKSFDDLLRHNDKYYYPSPLYAAAEYVNQNTPPDSKILVFGDARGFYLRRDHIASTPGQVTLLERWANSSASVSDLESRFRRSGITHIIVNHGEIVRLQTALHFSPHGIDVLSEFWKRDTLKLFQFDPNPLLPPGDQSGLHTNQMIVVYRILSEQEAASAHPADDLFADYNIKRS